MLKELLMCGIFGQCGGKLNVQCVNVQCVNVRSCRWTDVRMCGLSFETGVSLGIDW